MKAAVVAVAVLLGAVGSFAAASLAQEEPAPDHAHGAGILNIAIEGPTVTLDLALPAIDIVGFEHAPASDAEHTDLAQARAALQDPFQLIAFPPAADCAADSADIHLALDVPPRGTASDSAALVEEEGEETGSGHAEFVALFQLTCGRPAGLSGLGFPLFGLYPALESLHVLVITPGGQRRFVAAPGSPEIAFGDLGH